MVKVEMINRRQLQHDIENQKNIEETMPVAMNMIASDYYVYSAFQFTMNFYNYYELTCEQSVADTDAIFEMVNHLVEQTILSSFDGQVREDAIKQIDCLRTEILNVMEELTAYADKFAIYEYMLNRLEKNYEDNLEDMDNDSVTKDIMETIFSDNDQVLINARIRAMLSQLPVRMTKNRFFDMLKDSLSIYEGSDQSSVNDFLYMVRSASGLAVKKEHESTTNNSIKYLGESLKKLESIDFVMVSPEQFKEASDLLALAVEKIQNITDRYFSLQEVVNAYYCMLLNQPYISCEAQKEVDTLSEIIRAIVNNNKGDKKLSLEDDLVEKFEYTEGKLEQYLLYLSKDEAMIEHMSLSNQDMISSLMLSQQFTALQLSKSLSSNSVFIDLHEEKTDKKADSLYLTKTFNELVEDFTRLLEKNKKLYNRAVIASVLRELPVLFNSKEEVENYIKSALAGCHDIAEKISSIELFYSACE